MREYSSIIDPTEHVVLYTLSSLGFMARMLGFEIAYCKTQGLDIQNILAMQHYKGKEQNAFLIQWNNELQTMINEARCGDYARIMFRKP